MHCVHIMHRKYRMQRRKKKKNQKNSGVIFHLKLNSTYVVSDTFNNLLQEQKKK